MHVTLEGNELVIRLPLGKPHVSTSGKTIIIASTNGNVQTNIEVNGKPVYLGVNAYIAKK